MEHCPDTVSVHKVKRESRHDAQSWRRHGLTQRPPTRCATYYPLGIRVNNWKSLRGFSLPMPARHFTLASWGVMAIAPVVTRDSVDLCAVILPSLASEMYPCSTKSPTVQLNSMIGLTWLCCFVVPFWTLTSQTLSRHPQYSSKQLSFQHLIPHHTSLEQGFPKQCNSYCSQFSRLWCKWTFPTIFKQPGACLTT